ncbi:olfactory receptor 5G3-like isoform X2 [Hippopotamus amphibius kiboko]|uniref:olfactory receptor 5G3-like isoform X2 n=1 Tax=Hippopotamus amphibius kiboko TaxID=575201 RepID=UPI002593CB58|nr:olfactory receptor 5G3-like isoform X2 [Hippopotamus amphibius kiboko]XP_057585660.1 olfactory receptor 5G3-like isoform X2 [Hippopotamus amphibius kiboko]
MEDQNQTAVTEFLLLGLTDHLYQQIILFVTLLFIYLATLGGNLGMITLIWSDPRLHTPMYFFLSHLSFVDMCSSSSIAPKMLCDIFAEKKGISFMGCAAQMWFFGLFVATECFLLASMAYDRYMAVCKPLLYTLVMSQRVCVHLVIGPYAVALISTMTHTILTFGLPFCGPNILNHFFCDISPLLSLACADTWTNKLVLFILAGAIGVLSGLIITVSYICILVAILRIQTADGRNKAFSTCSSHLAVVSILGGTLFFTYVRPSSSSSLDINKVISLFYTVVTPMLNPLIYSLRNKEVKNAFNRKFERKNCPIGR